ncbi:MAG: DUF1501 domain-containing protein [Burkholderiales bacterium]
MTTHLPKRGHCADAYPRDLPDAGRRSLLKGLLGGGITAAAAPWMAPLSALAQTTGGTGYKALVCIFLFGGNDANNLLVPNDTAAYNLYRSARTNLALPQASLLPIAPSNSGGARYGLHPAMAGVQQLFTSGQAALVANVGPLSVPTSKAQYQARSVPLPNALFSHSDQQAAWQSAVLESTGRNGWGGRLMERLVDGSASNRGFAALSVSGGNLWEAGDQTLLPYKVGTSGDFGFDFYDPSGTDPLSVAIAGTLADPRSHLLQQAWLDVMGRSIEVQRVLSAALSASTLATVFPNTGLGQQLRMVARLIATRATLGLPRQVYFASLGGFDTHGDDQLQRQQELFTELSGAMSAFYQATVELGVAGQVTQFTASDFGRTLASNGQGSDHGWGSHHIVMGGGVRGGQLVGTFPNHTINGPDDTGSGRWIPSTSVDQYGATLGRWFGASDAQLGEVFTHLGAFSPDLGFMV